MWGFSLIPPQFHSDSESALPVRTESLRVLLKGSTFIWSELADSSEVSHCCHVGSICRTSWFQHFTSIWVELFERDDSKIFFSYDMMIHINTHTHTRTHIFIYDTIHCSIVVKADNVLSLLWLDAESSFFFIGLLLFPTLLIWLNSGPAVLQTRDYSYFCSFTLPSLNSERKLLLLLWFISRFCLFIRSQCSFVLSMICCFSPLQRPYYEIRLRVGGTTRFTSRIICCIILLQRKSTNHSSLAPFLMFSMLLFQDLCSLLIFPPVSL